MSFLHRVMHFLGLNFSGTVVSRTVDGRVLIGYRCDTCGRVDGEHDATEVLP